MAPINGQWQKFVPFSFSMKGRVQSVVFDWKVLLYREINCPEDYLKQWDVNRIANWVDVNKLTLNSKKRNII